MIELNEQQQAIEDGQLATEVLNNRIFQQKITENIEAFQKAVDELEPHNGEAFPILQSAKKYLALFLRSIEVIAENGKTAETGIEKERGLI